MRKRSAFLSMAASCLALLGACTQGPATDGAAVSGEPPPQDAAFRADNEQWRAQRKERLLQPDGWTSLIGLHWLELKAHYVGSGATNGIRLAKGPEKLGMIQQQGGRVFLVPEKDVPLTLDGEPLKGRVELVSDQGEAPSVVGFDDGKGQLTLIERMGRKALRVKHADAETRAGFAGLDYWPADAGWQIDARFVPHPAGKTIEIQNIIGSLEAMPNPGAVEFERDGSTYRLEALDEGGDELFLVMADRTSGHDSYGAGRYLYVPRPDAEGKVVVDFNRAYNPPCAFTAYATCPLPPPENRLDLAVTAGEKKYAKPVH